MPLLKTQSPSRMKHLCAIVGFLCFGIFAVWYVANDFISSEPITYYERKPYHLTLVLGIGIIGGLSALIFHNLSPRSRRITKLCALGFTAGSLTIFGVYMIYQLASLFAAPGVAHIPASIFVAGLGFPALTSAFMWIWFYKTFKERVALPEEI